MADKTQNVKTRLSFDGEAEYKAACKEINSTLKVLNSEMKLVTAEYKDNASSVDALKAKQAVLQKTYDEQAKKVKETEAALGFDGEIWQSVEDEDIAWHCGASSYKHAECRNSNSIGIELCVRKKNTKNLGATDKDWYFEDATVEAAAELTRYLMNKYGVPASHVIRHYDVTGKICPNPYVYNTSAHTWDEFKRKISEQAETPQGGNEKTIWNFLTGKGYTA